MYTQWCPQEFESELGIIDINEFFDISPDEASARPGTEDPRTNINFEERIGGGEINNEDNNNNKN